MVRLVKYLGLFKGRLRQLTVHGIEKRINWSISYVANTIYTCSSDYKGLQGKIGTLGCNSLTIGKGVGLANL